LGSSGCRREKASNLLVSDAARCAPRIALLRPASTHVRLVTKADFADSNAFTKMQPIARF